MPRKFFKGIQQALEGGLTLWAHGTGQAVKIVTLTEDSEGKGEKKGEGSMPNLRPALIVAGLDYIAGGGNCEVHYLTGTERGEETLDSWIIRGGKLKAYKENGQICLQALLPHERSAKRITDSTFHKAYDRLNQGLTKEDFRMLPE